MGTLVVARGATPHASNPKTTRVRTLAVALAACGRPACPFAPARSSCLSACPRLACHAAQKMNRIPLHRSACLYAPYVLYW